MFLKCRCDLDSSEGFLVYCPLLNHRNNVQGLKLNKETEETELKNNLGTLQISW